jgi:hypothetical protein
MERRTGINRPPAYKKRRRRRRRRNSCVTAARNVETDTESKELRNNIRQSEVFSINLMNE